MENAMQNMMVQVSNLVGSYVPNLLGALGVLLIGWLVALVLAAIVRGALRRTSIDNRIAEWLFGREAAEQLSVERAAGRVVFYIMMLFVLVAFFQALQLTVMTEPLNALLRQLTEFAPRILGAALILLVAVVVAAIVRKIASKAIAMTKLDERVSESEPSAAPLSKSIGDGLYWLVLLLFLPGVLGALQLEGMMVPLRNLTDGLLGFLPNLLAAALILVVGWFMATLIRRIVTNLLAAVGVDGFAERVGIGTVLGSAKLSGVLGLVVYALILLPVFVASLDALQLGAVAEPASNVLGQILGAIPRLFGAALVLVIAYVVGKVMSGLITNVLSTAGFDRVFRHIGISQAVEGTTSPSTLVGALTMMALMTFAAIEISQMLGFGILAELIMTFLILAGRVLLGLVIFGIGVYLGSFASRAIGGSAVGNARLLAVTARVGIVGLAGAMALRQMGLANEIISLAFGLLLGSIAVAAAIAFGIGARDVAGRMVEEWSQSIRK